MESRDSDFSDFDPKDLDSNDMDTQTESEAMRIALESAGLDGSKADKVLEGLTTTAYKLALNYPAE